MHINFDGKFFNLEDGDNNIITGSFENGVIQLFGANYYGYNYTLTSNRGWLRYGRVEATRNFNAWISHMENKLKCMISELEYAI